MVRYLQNQDTVNGLLLKGKVLTAYVLGGLEMVRINEARFFKDLEEQGRIGWKDGEGLFREAYSEDYARVRNYVEQKIKEAGLEARIDSVGNIFGRLKGRDPKAKTILTGSHLDAVKAGGMLDGAYGVIAGLEALRAIKESGKLPKHSLEVVGFIAEEGGPLGGTFGSRSFTGQMETPPADEVLNSFGITKKNIMEAKADIKNYAAFIELHIEQGPVLWRKGISVGIPTAIVGITRYKGYVTGEANHAGTTPMLERKDALYQTVVLLHQWLDFMRNQKDMVCNIGYIDVEPGEVGIVPGQVRFGVEIRSTEKERTQAAADKLNEILSQAQICDAKAELWVDKPPVKLYDNIIDAIEKVCDELQIQCIRMPSGASHDASPLARVMPTGMIFVPSINGISHNKEEHTEKAHLIEGTSVLANTLLELDNILE